MQHLIKYLIFWIIAWFRTRTARKQWAEAAQLLGGTFDPDSLTLQAIIDGVPLAAKIDRSVTTNTLIMRTILWASIPTPALFQLQVYKEGFFSSLGKSLGGQDLEIGDAAFDKAFIIKSNSEEVMRDLLSTPMRAAIQNLLAYSHKIEGKVITSTSATLEKDSHSLVASIKQFAALPKSGAQLAERWQQAIIALSSKPLDPSQLILEEGHAVEFESRGVHVSISLSGTKSGWISKTTEFYTTISVRLQNNQPSFYLYQHQNTAPKEASALPEAQMSRELAAHYKLRTQGNLGDMLASISPVLLQALPDLFSVDGKSVTATYGSLMISPEKTQLLVESMVTLALQSNQLYR
jgi:hypothetical protein